MNRRFLSIVLSTVLATSSLFTGATGVSAADESSGSAEKGSAVTSQSSKDDPVTLNVYGYRLSDKYYDGTGTGLWTRLWMIIIRLRLTGATLSRSK